MGFVERAKQLDRAVAIIARYLDKHKNDIPQSEELEHAYRLLESAKE